MSLSFQFFRIVQLRLTKSQFLRRASWPFFKITKNKATGPDETPGKFLKICAFELHEVFTILFQTSLDLGVVPDEWKVAHIFPLFKKGDKTKAENYRPISLTSISCKLLEHIVHSTLMGFLDSNEILSPFQHGFRQKRSCESQLLTTLRDFSESLNSSGQTDAILLDFSKAFDKVDHRLLLSKMNQVHSVWRTLRSRAFFQSLK